MRQTIYRCASAAAIPLVTKLQDETIQAIKSGDNNPTHIKFQRAGVIKKDEMKRIIFEQEIT